MKKPVAEPPIPLLGACERKNCIQIINIPVTPLGDGGKKI